MDKYDLLYEVGEEHLLNLMKIDSPRSIIGTSSDQIVFNKNDTFSITGNMILFYLDDGIYTLGIMILPNNTFKLLYYETDYVDDGNYLFTFNNVPYDISEEWYFQLSTLKRLPFSYEFHIKLKEFVQYCMKINNWEYSSVV